MMAYRRRELYSEDSAANLLRSVRQQEAQFEMLSRELEEERRNVAQQLEKCKYGSETASVSSMGSSTDESFVWRGNHGPGSIGDEQDFSDNESQLSGSELVDSCLKVLQERGLSDSRDEHDPFYDKGLVNGKSSLKSGPKSTALMNQDWEKDLMEADLTPGQTVKKVVTRTEVRTLKTVDGKVVQDTYDPGNTKTTIERYTIDNRAVNGETLRTPTKQYVPGDEYRSGQRGPGSQSSVEDYRRSYSPGSQSGPGSDGRRTPIAGNPTGYSSDGYQTATGSRHSSQSGSVDSKPYHNTSQSLPRTSSSTPSGAPSSSSTLQRSSSSSGRSSTTYNLSIKVGDVKGSGTDGNVYIQLFGERGNTAKIQLRQAGDARNKFEKGRTYKFTVDTVDIGKVDRIKLSHDHTGYGSGFFVEEVEVEVPARQDRVKFPCRCWLAQDVEDGKIEREMFAITPLPNTSYTMSVKLGDVLSPDTNLYVQLLGEKGETSKIMLRPIGSSMNKFEKGRTYKFTVETVNVGKIERLRIGHDSKGGGKGIFVEEVEVAPAEGNHAIFPCYCWLAEEKGDNKMERDILPGEPRPPRPNTSYHLAVKTGDMLTSGTDANVYFQLIGSEGETEKIQLRQGGKAEKRFEKGRVDKFIVETVDVGMVQKLRIGHDNNGSTPGWYLEEVAVDVPAHGQHVIFPCHRWLAKNEDDGKTERDLMPVVPGGVSSPTRNTTTTTTIERTMRTEGQRVPPPVAKKPEGKPQSSPTRKVITEELRYTTVPPPQKTTIEELRYTAPPPSRTVIEEEHRYTTSRKEPAPTSPQRTVVEERMIMKEGGYPVQGTLPVAPLETKQRITQEELTVESVRSQEYSRPTPKNEYLYREEMLPPPDEYHFEEKRTDMLATAPDSGDNRKIVAYQLCLKMGDVLGEGTEGNVFIQLIGDKGLTEQIQLRQAGNSKIRFEKGRTYKFTVETVDIGKIEKVSVGHDSRQSTSGWYLEEVTVDVPSLAEHIVFPSHCWLASSKGDGKIVRDFISRPCFYHLAIKTGDEKNSGTDASVWVQVYGDKGDTGQVQLKKSGMVENLFERGQTDYFTLEAGDVGKIEKLRLGHDGRGPASDWYVEEVILNSAVRGEHLIFACHAWVPDEPGVGTADKELYPKQPVADYSVRIKTGSMKNAATESNIYIQVFGDKGDTGVVEMKQICDTKDKFSRGAITKINLQTVDVGNLEKVRIGHDGRGLGTGWYLEEVVIIVHDECWIFPCNQWLADYEDDGKTERDLFAERKTYAHEPDLQDLLEYLESDDVTLIVNAANYLQHLSFSDDQVKIKVRGLGGIAILVRLLDHELEEVHRSAAACLRNLSFSKARDENKLAIAECFGIEALIRLLKRTRQDEVKEVVLGVLWNLSSCEDLKLRIIEVCLIVLITIIIVPYSGWTKTAAQSNAPIPSIKWSTVFRNASGVLRNVSSAGPEARRVMRDCDGLVDSFVWIIKAPIGKNDIDNKSVENSICILRNLSYRLENEVDRERYQDAPVTDLNAKEPEKDDAGCLAGCGTGSKKKKKRSLFKGSDEPQIRSEPVEGVELLWQPEIVKSYLSIMAEASNPETLEGSAGAIHNLTACAWRWSMVVRSAVRKEKGLPILVELLRMNYDPVVRAVSTALRNLAIDPRNKDLIGKYAVRDLVHRLPDPDNVKVEESTIGAILCAIHQVVSKSIENSRHVRNVGGVKKIIVIARSRDKYSPKIVKTANQVLITMWSLAPLRNMLKKEGWEFTKEIGDEFGHVPPTPRPYEDITIPRGRQQPLSPSSREPRLVKSDETTIPELLRYEPQESAPPPRFSDDNYETDDDVRGQRAPRDGGEILEMNNVGEYREIDQRTDLERTGSSQVLPPAYDSRQPQEEPQYAVVDKSKKKRYQLEGDGGQQADSWV
ncbi:uncharacterized protein LOC141875648 isoform X1 [Acropora palmata]|uniref:uncharacterized protein LOC141875648 isoform X1 n=2 Tax=Acropora palmata TaxID=6131 RepID=UPI003DA17BC2